MLRGARRHGARPRPAAGDRRGPAALRLRRPRAAARHHAALEGGRASPRRSMRAGSARATRCRTSGRRSSSSARSSPRAWICSRRSGSRSSRSSRTRRRPRRSPEVRAQLVRGPRRARRKSVVRGLRCASRSPPARSRRCTARGSPTAPKSRSRCAARASCRWSRPTCGSSRASPRCSRRAFPSSPASAPREVVRQFTRTLRAELDLAAECRNAERVAQSFRERSGDRRAAGLLGLDQRAGQRAGVHRRHAEPRPGGARRRRPRPRACSRTAARRRCSRWCSRTASSTPTRIPGNVFYLPGNRVAFIDFGMAGHLSERRRDELVRLLDGLVGRDAEARGRHPARLGGRGAGRCRESCRSTSTPSSTATTACRCRSCAWARCSPT